MEYNIDMVILGSGKNKNRLIGFDGVVVFVAFTPDHGSKSY
jgi:hypothetical protein